MDHKSPHRKIREAQNSRILDLKLQGIPYPVIAERLGIAISKVYETIKYQAKKSK